MSSNGLFLYVCILAIGEAVLWRFLRHAQKARRVSFFGFSPTNESDDPVKYRKIVSSYRLQMMVFPLVAFLAVWNLE
jgi:hypothetical protein